MACQAVCDLVFPGIPSHACERLLAFLAVGFTKSTPAQVNSQSTLTISRPVAASNRLPEADGGGERV